MKDAYEILVEYVTRVVLKEPQKFIKAGNKVQILASPDMITGMLKLKRINEIRADGKYMLEVINGQTVELIQDYKEANYKALENE